MMRVAANFVSNSGESSGSISNTDTFGGEVECGEYNGIVIFWTIIFIPSGVHLLEKLSVVSLLEYCFNVVMLDSESFTFMRALITRFLAVEWRVNPVLTYLSDHILALR